MLRDHRATAASIASLVIQASDPSPPVIPGFEIISLLGHGGMGAVWLALQQEPLRHVALKTLLGSEPTDAGRRSFKKEVQLLAEVEHPHVVTVFQTEQGQGTPWIAMAYVRDGQTLEQWYGRRRPSRAEFWQVCAKICLGLQALHSKKICHRDIKPSNVLITKAGEPVLIDLGIAEQDSPRTRTRTSQGSWKGSRPFMSPQLLGQVSRRGPVHPSRVRDDLFALGVTLFVVLTGELPYDSETVPVTMPRAHSRAAHVSSDEANLIHLLMRYDERQRPRDIGAVLAACQALAAGDRAGFSKALESTWLEIVRTATVSKLLATGGVLVLLGGIALSIDVRQVNAENAVTGSSDSDLRSALLKQREVLISALAGSNDELARAIDVGDAGAVRTAVRVGEALVEALGDSGSLEARLFASLYATAIALELVEGERDVALEQLKTAVDPGGSMATPEPTTAPVDTAHVLAVESGTQFDDAVVQSLQRSNRTTWQSMVAREAGASIAESACRAVSIAQSLGAPDHPEVLRARAQFAMAVLMQVINGELAAARAELIDITTRMEADTDLYSLTRSAHLYLVGSVELRDGDPLVAALYLRGAVESRPAVTDGSDDLDRFKGQALLAQALYKAGMLCSAEDMVIELVAHIDATGANDDAAMQYMRVANDPEQRVEFVPGFVHEAAADRALWPEPPNGFEVFRGDGEAWLDSTPSVRRGLFVSTASALSPEVVASDQPVDVTLEDLTVSLRSHVSLPLFGYVNAITEAWSLQTSGPGHEWRFSEPVHSFYTFVSGIDPSLTAVTLHLFSGESRVAVLEVKPRGHPYLGQGIGFRSPVPIDRLDVRVEGVDMVNLGTYAGLYPDEVSLGAAATPGFRVREGQRTLYDFALSTLPP